MALARELGRRGDVALIEPLLTIEPLAGVTSLDVAGVQAVVLTSANAVPALGAAARRLPVFAVGDATARAARRAGCATVVSAAGAGEDLARLIAGRCRADGGALLHPSGEMIRGDLADALAGAGFELRRQTVYRAVAARSLAPATIAALGRQEVDAVLLFSPRTARTFVALIDEHRLQASLAATAAICLSAAVAEPCRALVWGAIHTSARPELPAVLETLEAARRKC
jgi:uroporphyrinogen-III synthase